MKLGIITTSDISTPNGYLTRILSEIKQLARHNNSISILSFLHVRYWINSPVGIVNYVKKAKSLGCKVVVVPVFPDNQWDLLYKLADRYQTWCVDRFIHNENVSLLHCHGNYAAYLAVLGRRLSNLPIVFEMHGAIPAEQVSVWGPDSPVMKRVELIEKVAINDCYAVISVTDALQSYWKQKYPEVSPLSVVIPSAVDTDKFKHDSNQRSKLRSDWGIDNKEPVFVYLGSANYYQKIDLVFDLFKQVQFAFPRARLVMMSPQSNFEKIKRLSYELGIDQESLTLCSVSHDDVPGYLSSADFGFLLRDNVLLNNVSSPVKFGEYLSCGVPVIASPGIFDVKRAIEKYEIGFIYDDNVDSLISYIRTVMLRRSDWMEKCRMFAQDQYSWAKYGGTLQELYVQLTALNSN